MDKVDVCFPGTSEFRLGCDQKTYVVQTVIGTVFHLYGSYYWHVVLLHRKVDAVV